MLILSSPLTKICEGCGKEYTPDKQQSKRQKFCTDKCRIKTKWKVYEENHKIKNGRVADIKHPRKGYKTSKTHRHKDLYYGIDDQEEVYVCEICGRIKREPILTNKGQLI